MYNLYRLNDDLYQIHSAFRGEEAKEGTLLAILTYATHFLKFSPDELEFALLEMLRNGDDASQFGINRTFLFTFDRKTKKVG